MKSQVGTSDLMGGEREMKIWIFIENDKIKMYKGMFIKQQRDQIDAQVAKMNLLDGEHIVKIKFKEATK